MNPLRSIVTSATVISAVIASIAGCSIEAAPTEDPAGQLPSRQDDVTDDGASKPDTNTPSVSDDTVTKHTDGMPEISKASYFAIKGQGFPVYLAHLVGTTHHLFPSLEIKNPSTETQKVVLRGSLQGFTKGEGMKTLTLAAGETKTVLLDATLDMPALGAVNGQMSGNLLLSLETPDGTVLSARSSTTKIIPKNTVFWTGINPDNKGITEKSFVIGSMTTPHDGAKETDKLLKEAAPLSKYKQMIGYQYHAKGATFQQDLAGAMDQAGAIYNALKARGFNYTSVSEAFFDGQQNVRYPGESLKLSTANCIDGALVFASLLEAIGMEPFVVTITGHAFVGVHVAPKGDPNYASQPLIIETTMVGTATSSAAFTEGLNKWQKNPTKQIYELSDLRAKGYMPSPFPM